MILPVELSVMQWCLAMDHGSVEGSAVISVDTEKCLDTEVLSDKCKQCDFWEKQDKNTEEYIEWHENHNCLISHQDSACAMEANGIVRIFAGSEEQFGLRYTKYLGDGDSASFKRVAEANSYDLPITKL